MSKNNKFEEVRSVHEGQSTKNDKLPQKEEKRQREQMTITLDKQRKEQLKAMAESRNISSSRLIEYWIEQAIE